MRTITITAMAILTAGLFSACMTASAPRRQLDEWHRIVAIPKVDTEQLSSSKKNSGGERGERVVIENENSKTATLTGTWLARYRWEPYRTVDDQSRRRLSTIEIMFCPFDKADFTRCRVGVAWSRAVHPMGDQRFRTVSP